MLSCLQEGKILCELEYWRNESVPDIIAFDAACRLRMVRKVGSERKSSYLAVGLSEFLIDFEILAARQQLDRALRIEKPPAQEDEVGKPVG